MDIVDLNEDFEAPYFCCLEEWSDEMKEAGDHKEQWYRKMKGRGLEVKLAVEESTAVGMIQYLPVEESIVEGHDLNFINCIWVHGYKEGVGNHQKKGIGSALLAAAEDDSKEKGKHGMAAWGLILPFWMKASWFKKHGYRKADRTGMASLVWKAFSDSAERPRWTKKKKEPAKTSGKVTVTSFINGWCPAQAIVHERAKRAVEAINDPRIEFVAIDTSNKETFLEWGISDALYIDDKDITKGPPLKYDDIRSKIEKQLKHL